MVCRVDSLYHGEQLYLDVRFRSGYPYVLRDGDWWAVNRPTRESTRAYEHLGPQVRDVVPVSQWDVPRWNGRV